MNNRFVYVVHAKKEIIIAKRFCFGLNFILEKEKKIKGGGGEEKYKRLLSGFKYVLKRSC